MPTPLAEPIVVTGLGATTPLGGDASTTWEALLAGHSGARALDRPWAEQLPVRIAAPAAVDPAEVLGRVAARKLDRSQQLALVAAREAWADAGCPQVEPERLAVVVASGIGGVTTLLDAHDTLTAKGARAVGPHTVPMLMPNGSAAVVALELGARAGTHAPVSACASGAESIAMGLDLLRLGRADVVVCGGTEAAIHPLPMAGFAAMRALSTRNDEPGAASRPFDKGRDGFVLGEGAGVLVLERASSAAARGAHVYAELAGAGLTSDAHHIAAPDPEGAGAGRAVALAMSDAGAAADEVVHINPHATSTPLGDLAEVKALHAALGDAVLSIPVSATKSATGHLLGAAGGLEALLTVLALEHRLAPPTRNLDDPDDDVDLDVVRFEPRPLPSPGVALSTSFGFGGHNTALAFRSWTGAEGVGA
ncbi:MAG: 3-oxoacyl-[acyl-carrier-protein] synthase [Frankiaceae bacterium]|jgi:3-oxoacyl-[acyl-carrier-protein] synthase II|nr:3-oxoacyl-[acyl-carrier-protein] synthase [Frankiaceae bacterium]